MSPLIESVIFIPIFLVLFGGSLGLSAYSISHRITQWGCYQLARHTLVNAPAYLIENDKKNLRLIPWVKEPRINVSHTNETARVTVHQTLELFGKSYDLKETFTLHQ